MKRARYVAPRDPSAYARIIIRVSLSEVSLMSSRVLIVVEIALRIVLFVVFL